MMLIYYMYLYDGLGNLGHELPGNYPVFTMVMVIYHYAESIPPIFGITYTIMKNVIQVDHLIYISNH